MQNDFFDAPPEGAIQHGFERLKSLTYKACKTPKAYAQHADAEASVRQGDLGFSWYDKESRTKVHVPELTFVALEFYAGISGYDGGNTSYWSNRVRDTRNDPMVMFSSANPKTPMLSGLYAGKSASATKVATIDGQPLPEGASFTIFCKAWCLQLSEVVEIQLSAGVQEGMKVAVSDADARAGRRTDPEKIFLLGLTNGDYLWGFSLTGYEKTDKNWKPYAGDGDLFFRPLFHAGVLNAQKSPDLHAICVREQAAERARHESYRAKYAAKPVQDQPAATQPVGNAQPYDLPPANQATSAATAPAKTNITANHDLPPGDPLAAVAPPVEEELPF